MKKGFNLLETIVGIIIFSLISIVVVRLLHLTVKNNTKYTEEYFDVYELANIVEYVNNNFDITKPVDYEIDNGNLFLTNQQHFLLFYKDHTVFNNEQCNVTLSSFQFKNEFLIVDLETRNQKYQLFIKGVFHEIHSDQNI